MVNDNDRLKRLFTELNMMVAKFKAQIHSLVLSSLASAFVEKGAVRLAPSTQIRPVRDANLDFAIVVTLSLRMSPK